MRSFMALGISATMAFLAAGCSGGGDAPSDHADDESALCIDLGWVGCGSPDHGPKVAPQGWPIPDMAILYSDHFTLDAAIVSKMKPLDTNPDAVHAEYATSAADKQGIVCVAATRSCSLDLLVEASLVKDAQGNVVPSAPSSTPLSFAVHGNVAKLLLSISDHGRLGPLTCEATAKSAVCATTQPLGAIVNAYTPNNDSSKALAEGSLEPPAR